ncbi:replication initiator [Kineosporia babensis]|uniref:Replication initiation protein n=1 Tax=Kineosporia babensis TaxID=499548 RepID=A0A9X1SW52_9ACTN|nr:replication initiator [Kineosporia babensis]MCD5313570.1 replication initiation protein [Kineosporia babensis]
MAKQAPRKQKSADKHADRQLTLGLGLAPELAELIEQVNRPDHRDWLKQVQRIGGCSHPLHMRGSTRIIDKATGRVDHEFSSRNAPDGIILIRCRNRRAAVCPSCARIYQGDLFQLVKAGLAGGKGVPETVAGHPRVFITLTAPSFGAVHSSRPAGRTKVTRGDHRDARGICRPRRGPDCEHGRPVACFARHAEADPQVGTPLCRDCYDYEAAVIWQANLGRLWERFCIYLPRHLARHAGVPITHLRQVLRPSYVKVIEFQRRGLVHVHAVIRLDGRTDNPTDLAPAPAWATAAALKEAVLSAASAVLITQEASAGQSWALRWGQQVDVRDIGENLERGESIAKVAAYVAKYASKGSEETGWNPQNWDQTPRGRHAATMVHTAWALAERPELEHLKLRKWGKDLGYRGHVSSKSRRYSTTLGELRAARSAYRRQDSADAEQQPAPDVVVRSSWKLVGHGYNQGQARLAADVARDLKNRRDAARDERNL